MTAISLQPLGEKVLVKPSVIEEKTASGLYRADAGEKKSQAGEVIAIGSSEKIEVKVGQEILYKQYAGDEIVHEGVTYTVLLYSDILLVIK